MHVPVEFHVVLHEDADPKYLERVGYLLARFFVSDYVQKRDQELAAATFDTNESDQ